MKFLKFLIFAILFTCLLAGKSKKFAIVGAGPVGLYLSNELLKLNTTESVKLYEKRNSYLRPQCLRLPFVLAKKFPEEVKLKLWPIQSIRDIIFKNRMKSDKDFSDFWPVLGYQHFPRINVGNLQTTFIDYLQQKYSGKFSIEYKEMSPADITDREGEDIIFFTAGGGDFNKKVRKEMAIDKMKYDFINGTEKVTFDGVYLVYNNTKNGELEPETYMRKQNGVDKLMNRLELSKAGITYSATNNKFGNVQLYTYDIGEKFTELYKKLTQSVRDTSAWPKAINYKTGDVIKPAANLTDASKTEIKNWVNDFRKHLNELLKSFQINVPDDARLQWAPRYHYAFQVTHGVNKKKVPVVFAGDAMGGTDYKYGLNLGRGLYEADQFVDYLKKTETAAAAMKSYQAYWDDVLKKEFGDPRKALSDDNDIFYKYVVRGRNVDGRELGEDPKDVKFYVDAIKAKKQKRRLK